MFLYLVLLFVMLIYYFTKTRKALHMLQQNLYNENQRYLKWLKKNLKTAFFHIDLFGVVGTSVLFLMKDDIVKNIWLIMLIAFYLFATHVFINHSKTEQNKKPLVVTSRIKRLWVTLLLIFIVPSLIFILSNKNYTTMVFVESVLIVFSYILAYLANLINHPVERMVFHYYAGKAKKKLKNMANLKVVGITGSYGKTSSKNILNDILGIKYITKPTPKNFNTYYGLMITINNHLDKFDEVFLAEMGAYTRGDIKGLCDLVHPKYGVLTTIGTAHLESFGSEENIQKTKFELIESLPDDGVAVLNMDDEKQLTYELHNHPKKIWIAVFNQNADLQARNIRCTSKGTSFDLYVKEEDRTYPFETKLLGNCNVYNILAGLALGREFGISISDLQASVRKVRAVEHRLELKKLGAMYQIDDTYNSNPTGAKMALDVLSMMDGTKVVVTPGMVELGEKEAYYNSEFGRQIAPVADFVILVGKKRTKPIQEALLEEKFKEENLIVIQDVREAYQIVNGLKEKNKDIYALFENDLPDNLLTDEE